MKKIFALITCLVLSVMAVPAVADVAVAEIDTPWVFIGMPRVLHLEVTVPEGTQIEWTRDLQRQGFAASDYQEPEKRYMLEFGPDTDLSIDTIRQDGMVTYRQNLQFFAFDSAAMVIAPFRFVVNGSDTLRTQVLALKCEQPFEEVPEDPQAMQDLKPVISPDFVIWDYLSMLLWPLLIVALVVAGCLIYKYYKKHAGEKQVVVEEKKPELPPHVVALAALDDLSARKLWQQGQHKLYHTELTDILRTYIERRYGVPAMEKTSEEILEELVELTVSQRSSYTNLKEVFQIADFVKFAKYEPLPDENSLVYMNSRLFVEQTKQVAVPTAEGGNAETSESNNVQQ